MFSPSTIYFILTVSTALSLAASAPRSQLMKSRSLPANCDRYYAINLGDTCDSISAVQSVSTYQLASVNNETIDAGCDNLAVGEPICLGLTGMDCHTVHIIASGDGCDTISATAGIPKSTLLANNPNINPGCTNIYPGEVLCTATKLVYSS